MEESRLNFNAPILSLRRLSSTSVFSARDKQKKAESSPSAMGHIVPFVNTDLSLDMVTEPVAVPFVWEQIPGKAKGGTEHEFRPNKEAADVCCNALDTLSLTDSFSRSGSVAKPSGTFSACPQHMSHFSPAAKVMAVKTPPYASRKQSMELEQYSEVPPVNHYEPIIIPHYDDSYTLSRTLCGLLPRLCFLNSICLFNHVPRIKVRTCSSMSSTREIGKPGKAISIESHSQIVDKHAWDGVCNNKSDSRVQSARHPENKSDGQIQSYRLPEIGKTLSCGSNQFSSSNDLHMVNWLPPKRHPGTARISPYRREKPQSLFSGRGFLGMPKEVENLKYTSSNNFSQELVPYLSTKQESHSLSPLAEKTMYVESASIESSLQDEITGSENSSSSSFSDKPDLIGTFDQGEAKGGSDYAHLPPPLPKTPSESWLSRALPAVALRNSFSKSYNGTCPNPKKQEHKVAATDTKWETIVRTSYLHHDHARYSKELGTYLSQQSKT